MGEEERDSETGRESERERERETITRGIGPRHRRGRTTWSTYAKHEAQGEQLWSRGACEPTQIGAPHWGHRCCALGTVAVSKPDKSRHSSIAGRSQLSLCSGSCMRWQQLTPSGQVVWTAEEDSKTPSPLGTEVRQLVQSLEPVSCKSKPFALCESESRPQGFQTTHDVTAWR